MSRHDRLRGQGGHHPTGRVFPLPANARHPGLGQLPNPTTWPGPPAVVPPLSETGRLGQPCTPAEVEKAEAEQSAADALIKASLELIWYNQPSPIVEPPFRADVLDRTFARAVINVPTAPGDADAALGAIELAAAESAISGQAIPILTPATTADLVRVLRFRVPTGHALYVHSIGAWGHDFLASREVIQWRVIAGGRVVTETRELGLQGSLDTPVRVHAIVRENGLLDVEVQNRDAHSASLVEVLVFGWLFPVLRNDDTFRGLLDPQRGPKDQGRYAPGNTPKGC